MTESSTSQAPNEYRSKCCQAPITSMEGNAPATVERMAERGHTFWMRCDNCNKPCDVLAEGDGCVDVPSRGDAAEYPNKAEPSPASSTPEEVEQHEFPPNRWDEACVKCAGFEEEPCEPPESRKSTPPSDTEEVERLGRKISLKEAHELALEIGRKADEALQNERGREAEMFRCLGCDEKDEHIRSLQSEIDFLEGKRAKGNTVLVPADKLKEMQEKLRTYREDVQKMATTLQNMKGGKGCSLHQCGLWADRCLSSLSSSTKALLDTTPSE